MLRSPFTLYAAPTLLLTTLFLTPSTSSAQDPDDVELSQAFDWTQHTQRYTLSVGAGFLGDTTSDTVHNTLALQGSFPLWMSRLYGNWAQFSTKIHGTVAPDPAHPDLSATISIGAEVGWFDIITIETWVGLGGGFMWATHGPTARAGIGGGGGYGLHVFDDPRNRIILGMQVSPHAIVWQETPALPYDSLSMHFIATIGVDYRYD